MIDLLKFHRDPDLISDYFCALICPPVSGAVFNAEHMPDIKAINLDGNKLDTDITLRMINLKLLKVKILHIGDNSIDIEEELKLAQNPICNEYQYRNDYI